MSTNGSSDFDISDFDISDINISEPESGISLPGDDPSWDSTS